MSLRRQLLSLMALAVVAWGAKAEESRVRFAEVHSAALGRALPLAIVSPAPRGGAPARAVLFMLHGRGRNHRSLLDAPAARAALLAAPFHIVLPQGEDGWYVDLPARTDERYGAYLEEVVRWADANLRVSREPSQRGIAGWSMGGYGAVRFAETHREQFGFVASVIGLLDFPRAETLPEGQNYRVPVQRFSADPEVWVRFNPLHGVADLRGRAVTLVLATRGFERTMNENFLAALAKHGIEPKVHWLDGGHEFAVVERALPLVLADATRFFTAGGERNGRRH